MSHRHRQLKRLRYYQQSIPDQDRMAKASGLEIVTRQPDCDYCTQEKHGNRSWVSMSGGPETEIDEEVCSNCLPMYYRMVMAEHRYWTDRERRRWENHVWNHMIPRTA